MSIEARAFRRGDFGVRSLRGARACCLSLLRRVAVLAAALRPPVRSCVVLVDVVVVVPPWPCVERRRPFGICTHDMLICENDIYSKSEISYEPTVERVERCPVRFRCDSESGSGVFEAESRRGETWHLACRVALLLCGGFVVLQQTEAAVGLLRRASHGLASMAQSVLLLACVRVSA